ncbi:VOC family protein [Celeribacter litoreus]|uniref:VOC family protein n=1 Tax=Celeribacter litoreus TaxID=2876714 RepID=UPI001CCD08DF|nr:VOC family protein [Celeribacter litoreus]MCA0044205.1 VOC family protein [Celeribacter litoreus]
MITTYLHFEGHCEEAMHFYQSILGGTLDLMRYEDMPDAPEGFKASKTIMHSALMSPYGDLMASDYPPHMDSRPQASVSVSLEAKNVADGRRIYGALVDGGTPTQEYGATFFSPGFGMCVDTYGTSWIVMVAPAEHG